MKKTFAPMRWHTAEAKGGIIMKTHSLRAHESTDSQESTTPPRMGRLTFGDMYLELPVDNEHKANRKVLGVLGREVKHQETGQPVFTFQQVADQLEYGDRRDVQNFHRELRLSGFDIQGFVTRKATKPNRLFPLIEAAILETPLLSPHQQYLQFCEDHPAELLSEETFRKYANEIDGLKIVKRMRQVVKPGTDTLDLSRYLAEVLACERLSHAKKKEIGAIIPEAEDASWPTTTETIDLTSSTVQQTLLVVFLFACNVSQEVLGLLMGMSKASMHYWIAGLCTEEFEWQMLREITWWSGKVSFDEKWIKIKGEWYFVLCAVDSISGFPLLMALYPTLDTVSWMLFFKRFRALYGRPILIQSDGSHALAAARAVVFAGVRWQLCKFHKLKNLMKRLRQQRADPTAFTRCVRLAKHIFTNTSVSSRKYAAKTLQKVAGQEVSEYIAGHILEPWRHLTLSLTNNAAERFNRKIKKCFSGRYGIASPESAAILLRSLWLKEILLNGQQHLDATSPFRQVQLSRTCQEYVDTSQILHFFHDHNPELLEKVG
jgi:transposase-like protein